MSAVVPRGPVQPGEPAPTFTLPAVEREGTVSLADYRGKSPLFLSINRGLWCSFCRRHIALLGGTQQRLRQLGIETLAIVASPLERARLYVRHRPLGVPLAADPDQVSHRAYGLPRPSLTPEIEQAAEKMRVHLEDIALNPADLAQLRGAVQGTQREQEQRMPVWDFIHMQRALYPYEMTEREQREWTDNRTLGAAQFLVDRDGLVRWTRVQAVDQPPAGLGNYPSEAEVLAAAQALSG
jgi:peroxiredoxin